MTAKKHVLTTLAEIAKLTPEEFERMLPDLILWHSYAHTAPGIGLESCEFDWIDDGRPGELHSLSVNGEILVKGPAFTEDGA